MRVVGIALVVSTLCAACALQPADGSDEVSLGSSQTSGATVAPVQATLHGEATTGARVGAGGAEGTALPANIPPSPCSGPPCDPQPQPWGGNPPPYLLTSKH
jgi:hypothetical protein